MRWIAAVAVCFLVACDDGDGGGTEADRVGIAGECQVNDDCDNETDVGVRLTCLRQFKGGYCGALPCSEHNDCPSASLCVAHEGTNVCFRACDEKIECNRNRSGDNEANCSASIEFVGETEAKKACVPPSSGS